MTVFLVIGLIGAALLLVSLVFDGVDEVFGVLSAGDGLFSLTAIGSALTLVGVSGITAEALHAPFAVTLAISIAFGIVTLIGVGRLVRWLKRASRPVTVDLVGVEGVTTARTSPTIGEVKLNHSREINKRLAVTHTDETLPEGTPITVVEVRDGMVRVSPTPQTPPEAGADWPTLPSKP